MNHPILSIVSRREFERLSRQVQLCEIAARRLEQGVLF
jgi:hypothetical protein